MSRLPLFTIIAFMLCATMVVVAEKDNSTREAPELRPVPYHAVTGDYQKLKLSPEQGKLIKSIQAVERARVRLVQQETRGQILDLLSDEQKLALATMEAEREEKRRAELQRRFEKMQAEREKAHKAAQSAEAKRKAEAERKQKEALEKARIEAEKAAKKKEKDPEDRAIELLEGLIRGGGR